MKINNGWGGEYYLINVYLPYECTDNRDEFIDCLAKLGVFIDNINSTYITIVGDFNANLSRASLFGDLLLNIIDKEILPNDTYTYVSYLWGSTSWLDHVICTADAKQCAGDIMVVYDCVLSDHHPVIYLNIITACYSEVSNDIKQIIHWDNLTPFALERYKRQTEIGLNLVNIPEGVKCTNPNCQTRSHVNDIDEFYDCIFSVLTECSDGLSNMNSDSHIHDIQGWNDDVKDMHAAARDAYLIWKLSDRARHGVFYDLMQRSRSWFKYALRLCKRNRNTSYTVADRIAHNLCQKDDRAFWGEVKHVTNSKIKLTSKIWEAHGSVNITSMPAYLKLSAQPYGQPNAKYVHFCTCTRYLMCT